MKKSSGRITAVHSRFQSADVRIKEDLDFSSLISSPLLLRGLTAAGYQRPSPIQLKAIPLGRLGLDIIAQAKSGTGKTIVFSVIAIEVALGRSSLSSSSSAVTLATGLSNGQVDARCSNNSSSSSTPRRPVTKQNRIPQVVILAPTREIAVQITEVIQALVSEGLQNEISCHAFIGGLPVKEDKKHLLDCSIVVGTPGRVRQLIETGDLKTSQVKLLVLDEADKLMEEGFQEDVVVIAERLARGSSGGGRTEMSSNSHGTGGKARSRNQVMAFSATYDDQLLAALDKIVRNNPQHIMLCPDQHAPELAGVMQYYKVVHPSTTTSNKVVAAGAASAYLKQARVFESKRQALHCLLEQVPFHQAFVFLNHHGRALELVKYLDKRGWPALFIASAMTQEERLQVMAKARNFELRVLVCTDLIARGIDIERVNLVVSLDVPRDAETYFHRIGRTGRFGTMGLAVGIVDEQEARKLEGWQQEFGLHLQEISSASEADEAMDVEDEGLSPISNSSAATGKVYDFSLLNQQTQGQHHERPLQNEEDLAQFEKLESLRQHAAENFVEDEEEEQELPDEEQEEYEDEDGVESEGEDEDAVVTENGGDQEHHDTEPWYPYHYYNYQGTEAPSHDQYSSWEQMNSNLHYYNDQSWNTGNRNTAHTPLPLQSLYPPSWHPSHVYYHQHYVPSPATFYQSSASFSAHSPAPSFIPPDLPF
ncbi:DEAD (Asp-Glu-Ala-Asp) box polypeptide 20 [Actinomortierella ambigua]|nr:DEAD (Asp-Glu-Ala-Asp) box polypeptide 20 [Actinomortierella ambigua]